MFDGNPRSRVVILAGPSAVGKSTVVHRLRQEIPQLYFSVSMTTRQPRPGEVNGEDYLFVTWDEFQRRIDDGQMLEWADIHGGLQRSGTPAEPVYAATRAQRPVLIEVDLAGARALMKALPDAVSVFLAPPSWETLVQRLTRRGTETPDNIDRRLVTAREELAAQHEFDRVIVNDDVDSAVGQLRGILCGTNV